LTLQFSTYDSQFSLVSTAHSMYSQRRRPLYFARWLPNCLICPKPPNQPLFTTSSENSINVGGSYASIHRISMPLNKSLVYRLAYQSLKANVVNLGESLSTPVKLTNSHPSPATSPLQYRISHAASPYMAPSNQCTAKYATIPSLFTSTSPP